MFMFACQMTFFYKMAVLISVTIFFSLVYSLGFLIAAMITIGPQKNLEVFSLFLENAVY